MLLKKWFRSIRVRSRLSRNVLRSLMVATFVTLVVIAGRSVSAQMISSKTSDQIINNQQVNEKNLLANYACAICHTSQPKDEGVAVTGKPLTPKQIADFYHQGRSAQEHIKTLSLNNQISLLTSLR